MNPCPQCGTPPVLMRGRHEYRRADHPAKSEPKVIESDFTVWCLRCGLRGAGCQTSKAAVADWNDIPNP